MKRRALLAGSLASGLTRPAHASEMRVFGRGAWKTLLATNAGRQAIIHFWGLTCGPCMTELPIWGQFARSYPKAPIILIAADPAPQPGGALASMLDRAGLTHAESWRFDNAFPERLYFEVDPEWQGELPRTTLLTAAGQQDSWLGATDFTRLSEWLTVQ